MYSVGTRTGLWEAAIHPQKATMGTQIPWLAGSGRKSRKEKKRKTLNKGTPGGKERLGDDFL